MLDCEAEDEIQPPKKIRDFHDTFRQLKLFVYKFLIICVLGGMSLTISGAVLLNKMSRISVPQILTKGGSSLLSSLETKFSNASEELKQKRINIFLRFVESIKPYIQGLHPLFLPPSCEGNDKDEDG